MSILGPARHNSPTPMVPLASLPSPLLPLLFLLFFLTSCPADTVHARRRAPNAPPQRHVNWRTFLKRPAPHSLLRGQLTDWTSLLQLSTSEGEGQLAYTTTEASGNEAVRSAIW